MTQTVFRPLSVGEILDQAFGLYRRNLAVLLTITLACTAVPQIALSVIEVRAPTIAAKAAILPWYFPALISFVVLSQLAIGASTLVLAEGYLGRELGTGEALRRAWRSIGKIVGLSMSSSLVVFLGLLLLLVPGVIVFAGLTVSTPALMIEPNLGPGRAMSRSWELTRGFRWRMLVLLLVPGVIMGVAAIGMGGVLGVIAALTGSLSHATAAEASLGFQIAEQVIGDVLMIFLTPLIYCVITVAYFDLRVRTEGLDLELLNSSLPGHG